MLLGCLLLLLSLLRAAVFVEWVVGCVAVVVVAVWAVVVAAVVVAVAAVWDSQGMYSA
jgi:hypothetical protein